MTETLRHERPRCRSLGVWPRGAQLRRRSGAIKNPASSMKTIAAPRRPAFFLPAATFGAPNVGWLPRRVLLHGPSAVVGSNLSHPTPAPHDPRHTRRHT